jgi:hypothetical protein
MAQQFVIWSEEHGAWWGADETNLNYTRSLVRARRYSQVEAYRIADDANRFLPEGEPLREVPISDPLQAYEPRRASWPAIGREPG